VAYECVSVGDAPFWSLIGAIVNGLGVRIRVKGAIEDETVLFVGLPDDADRAEMNMGNEGLKKTREH
jgi:hypothetical protein